MKRTRWKPGWVPKRSRSGRRARVYSTATGMSWPVSGPNDAKDSEWWLRKTPGCRVMTRPSSQDMRAISKIMWARKAFASGGVTVPARADR